VSICQTRKVETGDLSVTTATAKKIATKERKEGKRGADRGDYKAGKRVKNPDDKEGPYEGTGGNPKKYGPLKRGTTKKIGKKVCGKPKGKSR